MALYYIKKNNNIKLNRGDSLDLAILLTKGKFPKDEPRFLLDTDIIYFAFMFPKEPFERCLLKKELTPDFQDEEGYLHIPIYPEDTINLFPGVYYYEIKVLHTDTEEIETVLQRTKFTLID